MRRVLTICWLLAAVPLFAATPRVDAIYYDGNVITGVGLPAAPQRVAAIAVRGHEIVAAGDDATVLRLKQPGTQLVDLKGAFVMPGFNDAHVHLADAGQTRLSVDLNGCTSLADMLRRVGVAANQALPGQWLLGGGWDHTLWSNQTLPTRQDLDRVTAGHPTLLDRVDGHIAVANSAALGIAGVTGQTPNPAGGQFDHDAKW